VTAPIIIDAGPALNFLATKNERLLLSVIGGYLSAPETVDHEVRDKGASDARFTAAPAVWSKLLAASRLSILSDDITPALAAATNRICGTPLAERKRIARDLGETMVVAHAAVLAEAGHDVTVLIDDEGGARMATAEHRRLTRLRPKNPAFGSIRLVNTVAVLVSAAGKQHIPDKASMRRVYQALRACDDGLVPIDQTRLLSRDLWSF
jgi:hypothetical protein